MVPSMLSLHPCSTFWRIWGGETSCKYNLLSKEHLQLSCPATQYFGRGNQGTSKKQDKFTNDAYKCHLRKHQRFYSVLCSRSFILYLIKTWLYLFSQLLESRFIQLSNLQETRPVSSETNNFVNILNRHLL